MTDQNKYNDPTRTVVSELVLSTNELTKYVISLLDSVSVDVDSLIVQLKAATDKIDAGVADLEEVRDKTLQDIHQAQEDISGVYEVFMQESQKLRNDLAGMYTQADDLDRRLDTLEGAQRDLETLYTNLGVLAKAIEADINTSNIKVRDIQGRIAQAESDVAGLRAQLTSLATDLQQSLLSVADFEARMSVLEQKVTTAATDIMFISDQIAKCVADINVINQRVSESETKSKDALELANTAYATVNSLTVDVGVLSTKLDQITNTYNQLNSAVADANANVNKVNGDVDNLITSVNNTTTLLTNRLSAMEGDLQAAGIKLDQANSMISQLETNISTLNLDYQTLSVDVRNQISAATSAANTANTSAEALASQVATLTAQMVDYTNQANQANQNIQHLNDDLVVAKADLDAKVASTNQVLADTKAEALTLNNDTRSLRNEVQALSLDVSNKTVQIVGIAQHVDEQAAYVDLRVTQLDTEYLRKLERAADTALFMGKDISYFAHDDNFESKLDASTGIATVRGEIAALKNLMSVDNENLNSLQEIVDFIEQNRTDLENLGIANIAGLQAALDGKLAINGKAVDSTLFDGQAIGYFVHDGNFNTKLDTQAVIATIRSDITARSLTTHNHDGRYFRADADSSGAGNITITSTSSRAVNVQGNGSGVKGSLNAYSNGTGAGEVYVGKSNAIGGGMVFGGVADASTAGIALAGGGVNNLILYRQTAAGVREWTARNANNSNNWEFRGTILAQGVFDGANRVFSIGNLPDWSHVTNKPAEATRWPTYAEVTGKPTEFTPSAHTHLWAHITDKPTTFTPSAHTHLWAEITDKPATFTPSAHNHYNVISQGRQAAWSGTTDPTYTGLSMVQAFANGYPLDYGNVLNLHGDVSGQIMLSDANKLMLRAKAAGGSWTDWTQVYTKLDRVDYTELLNVPTEFTPAAHTHPWAQITGVPAASVSQAGIVQLNSAINSTSATMAATSAAVKTAYDLAAAAVPKSGATLTGALTGIAANGFKTAAQADGSYAGISAEGGHVMLWRRNASATKSDEFISINNASQLRFRKDAGAGDSTYQEYNVYHQGYKPTAAEVGAVSTTGGNISGELLFTGNGLSTGLRFLPTGTNDAFGIRCNNPDTNTGELEFYSTDDDVEPFVFRHYTSGTNGSGTSVEWVRIDNEGVKVRGNLVYHPGNKPSAADVGLGSVNNWGATSAVNDASNTKYATAGAVKTAYDLAANALPKNGGGSVIGMIESTGANGKFQVLNPNDGAAMTWLGFINDRATIRYGGTGVGSTNGFQVVGVGDGVKMYVDNVGEIFAKGTEKVFHTSNLPTATQIGALDLAAGGTVAGQVNLTGNRSGMNSWGLNLGNQNIGGVNGIFFNDPSDAANEGLMFPKTGKLGTSTVAADFDCVYALDGKLYINTATVYDTVNKPTATDVGLGSVQNWTYSNSYTGGSASKYATEKAVTDAYNALNTSKVSKGGDTFTAQMVFSNGANTIGGGGDLTKAWALFGTTANGLGIDTNEIHQSGDNLYLSADAAKDIQLRIGGTTTARVNSSGLSTSALSANSVALIGGPTMAYNSTTGCLEITFA